MRKLLRRSQGGAALLNVQDASGYTALMTAAEHGREEIVRLLLQWDACSAVARNKLNHTAIELADWCGHRGVCLALEARMAAAGQLSAQTQALLAAQQLQRAATAAANAAASVCGPGAVGSGAGSGGGGGRDSATGSSGSHASSPVGAGQRASNTQSPHAGGLVGGMASLGMGEGGAADASLVSLSAHFARILFVTQACRTNLPFLHILPRHLQRTSAACRTTSSTDGGSRERAGGAGGSGFGAAAALQNSVSGSSASRSASITGGDVRDSSYTRDAHEPFHVHTAASAMGAHLVRELTIAAPPGTG